MRRRLAGMLFAVCLLLSLCGCGRRAVAGQGFRLPLSAEPVQLDPQVAADDASVTVLSALMEGLTHLDEQGTAQPALAIWTVSPDGCTYTFTLREAVWSNGDPVCADDFVFAITRLVLPDTRSALSSAAYGIAGAQAIREQGADLSALGVRAVDANTLEITLTQPDARFPETLATSPFYPCPRAFFEQTGGRYGLEAAHLLSNGPFVLAGWTHGESLLLNKNETYWDAASIAPSRVRFLVASYDDPVEALLSGEIDVYSLTVDQSAAAAKQKIQIVELQDTVQCLWFNNEVTPLDTADVRRALRGALEMESLRALLEETGQGVATGFLPPDTRLNGELYRTDTNALSFAPLGSGAQAAFQSGLAAAGQTEPLTLTLLCADDSDSVRLAQLILQSWQKNLSVYWELQPLPAADLAARVQVGNYQLALYSATGTSSSAWDSLAAFGSTATQGNLARFHDVDFDAQLAALQSQSVTREEVEQLERYLWDQVPCVPLSDPVRTIGIAPDITGLVVRPFGGSIYDFSLDFRAAMRPAA